MPISDFWIVVRWWGTLFFVGAAAFPLTGVLFERWHDRGYLFSKAVGMALVSWIIFVLAMARIAPFTVTTIAISTGLVFILGFLLPRLPKSSGLAGLPIWKTIIIEELLFFLALLFWSWVKAHEPSIRGLEKFMDYGFMNSILHSQYFPPPDMWYPPYPINYYYFGHLVTAVLTRLSGLDLSYTFNLMLSTIFALCLTMSFSIGYQLSVISHSREGLPAQAGGNPANKKDGSPIRSGMTRNIFSGLFTAFLVTLAGNMQTIYAFTKGYPGDKVEPIWTIQWTLEGLQTYWYANATRFIPYTIHEFPSYSFVVSDVHGHVLSIPFVLLAVGLLMRFFSGKKSVESWGGYIFYGFLAGVLLMTNALDGPIYLGLFIICSLLFHREWKGIGVAAIAAIISSMPFLFHFKSFVSGVAVNCPPVFVANRHLGPLLFESVDKCQRSPLWMMYLLWGFFWYCGIGLIVTRVWRKKFTQVEKVLGVFFCFSVALLIFPEFFYFKDIYPMHFRSNTMFKLGYEAFILCSIVSAYVIIDVARSVRKHIGNTLFLLFLLPQLFLVSIFPYFSVRSYFGQLQTYESIWGLGWLQREYPDNYKAIQWLNQTVNSKHLPAGKAGLTVNSDQRVVLVEADGDSYTDYDQFSVFTGSPTVVGWAVHEWLWRGTYDVVSPRREEVRKIYESEDISETKALLDQYAVRYIIVGTLERQKFTKLAQQKFVEIGHEVFRHGETVIYELGD